MSNVMESPVEQEGRKGSLLCGKSIAVDENGQGLNFKMCSLARPHMRAFHLSWMGFFVAFTSWFAFAPLMPSVRKDLGLEKSQIASANIASIASTILFRIIVGPLCDKYGARRVFAVMLTIGGIPAACGGLVNSAGALIAMRAIIGTIGCVFVPCQMWTTYMFAPSVVGAANAMVGGWGNLGGGFTYLLMPQIFSMWLAFGVGESMAWRLSFIIPGLICLTVAAVMFFKSDDNPAAAGLGSSVQDGSQFSKEQLAEAKAAADADKPSAAEAFKKVLLMPSVWFLVWIYGMCFGVELSVNNQIGLYFYDQFRKENCDVLTDENQCRVLTQSTAGLIASLFGLMNLFARGMGGFASDAFNTKFGLPGRLFILFMTMAGEVVFLMLFQSQYVLATAMVFLVCFSTCVQMSEGATYGVVPYVNKRYTGTIAGLVGAGGNAGGVACGFIFKAFADDPRMAYRIIAAMIATAALMCWVTQVQGTLLHHMFTRPSASSVRKEEQMEAFKASVNERITKLEEAALKGGVSNDVYAASDVQLTVDDKAM